MGIGTFLTNNKGVIVKGVVSVLSALGGAYLFKKYVVDNKPKEDKEIPVIVEEEKKVFIPEVITPSK